ncbi:MAG: hypothetical protein WDO13_14330 [Verrucomicrobiota bacterium]
MSGHPHTVHLPPPERLGPGRVPVMLLFAAVAIVGLVLSGFGIASDPAQFAYSWFFAFYYFLSIALGAFFWVTLHYACDSDWSVLARRVWENILALFPILMVISIPLTFPIFRDVLWKWTAYSMQNDHELVVRNGWYNLPFFYSRGALYFLYFCIAGLYYYRHSVEQDTDGSPIHTRRLHDHSYMALVIFGLLQTFLGCDWLAGLDWKWSSSLFGVYTYAVSVQAGLAAGIVLIALFRRAGYLQAMNQEHFYLMGKLLFGFSIFWGYIAFGQYLLIWYANIPDETIFYNDHNRGDWRILTYFLVGAKYVFPVAYLLAQDNKKSLRALTFISAWLLFMHGVELYWFVAPYAHPHSLWPSWQDVVAFLTVGSILGFSYVAIASRTSLFPAKDPRLVESLTITN